VDQLVAHPRDLAPRDRVIVCPVRLIGP
jgi:hypothetical protein